MVRLFFFFFFVLLKSKNGGEEDIDHLKNKKNQDWQTKPVLSLPVSLSQRQAQVMLRISSTWQLCGLSQVDGPLWLLGGPHGLSSDPI